MKIYYNILQLSFGPIGWLMISEIFPLRLRGKGLSIAVLVNFASNALVTFAFSPLEVLFTFSASCYVILPVSLGVSDKCLIHKLKNVINFHNQNAMSTALV